VPKELVTANQNHPNETDFIKLLRNRMQSVGQEEHPAPHDLGPEGCRSTLSTPSAPVAASKTSGTTTTRPGRTVRLFSRYR